MPKFVVSLTDSKIRSAISQHKKSPDKAAKLSDGVGLYLLIDRKGGTYWRYDYVRPMALLHKHSKAEFSSSHSNLSGNLGMRAT